MRDTILNFPKQLAEGIKAAEGISLPPHKQIIMCGMGGSAIPGEILSTIADNVVIHWSYDLPASTSRTDAVICVSWSGNTEETISGYRKARELGIAPLTITTGGKLAKLAEDNRTPLILLKNPDIQPRTAVGYMTGALLAALKLASHLPANLNTEGLEEEGKKIATSIGKKIPLIYTSYPHRKIAGFWKILFNENAKVHAFANWAPSAVHNEIAGFQNKNRNLFFPVIIRSFDEDVRYKRNLDALLAIFDKMEYTYSIVNLPEVRLLEQVFQNYILALWSSFYLAKNLGVDPGDTALIEEFKKLKKS